MNALMPINIGLMVGQVVVTVGMGYHCGRNQEVYQFRIVGDRKGN